MFYCKNVTTNKDLSPFVTSYSWSGDLDQAGRKLDFEMVMNPRDVLLITPAVNLGDKVQFYEVDDTTKKQYNLFTGTVFLRSRNSESYTISFTAYDDLIYLAKNKFCKRFDNITIKSVIEQVTNEAGFKIGRADAGLDKQISFVADNMTGSEIIKKALLFAAPKRFHCYMTDGKINIVDTSTLISSYKITDKTNLTAASHSESLENMVNKIVIVDKDGNKQGEIKNDSDFKKYGQLQDIYKIDEKQDTQAAAQRMLKSIEQSSSVTAAGNIQVIAGYSVEIQEEQIKGKFLIKSDSHKISGANHTMQLNIEYKEVINDNK